MRLRTTLQSSFIVVLPYSSSSAYSLSFLTSTTRVHRRALNIHSSLIRKTYGTPLDSWTPSAASHQLLSSSLTRRFMSKSANDMNPINCCSNNSKVALLQFQISSKKDQNHIKALEFMTRAVTEGQAKLLVLVRIAY